MAQCLSCADLAPSMCRSSPKNFFTSGVDRIWS